MGRDARKHRGRPEWIAWLLVVASVGAPRLAAAQSSASMPAKSQKSVPAKKTAASDVPDGDLDVTDLWPSQVQSAVETDTIALQPALSITGGSGGASTPSFMGDPSFDGDTFEVNGQDDIVIPYFVMADQMRLDFEDGHQLQGPAEQPTQTAIKKTSAAGAPKTIAPKKVDVTRFHGMGFWNGGNSIFNASPFVLAGDSVPNPAYNSNNYGLTVGLAPFVPGHTKPSRKDFIEVSYAGQWSSTLVNDFGLVPTARERLGDFSDLTNPDGSLIPIYPPRSTVPYPNNTIDTPLDPVAVALLNYLPAPNLNGSGLNFRHLTTQGIHGNAVGTSFTHNFGPVEASGQPTDDGPTEQLNVTFNFGDQASDLITLFPAAGGKQHLQGYSFNVGYNFGKGDWLATLNLYSNRNNAEIRNPYTGGTDIASRIGMYNDDFHTPINADARNYGLPSLILNGFSNLMETQPNFQLTQATGASGAVDWVHRSHVLRIGGNVRRTEFNLFGGTNATGSLIFTGGYTQITGSSTTNPVSTTGSSFADFLLGLPQQTRIESPDAKAYARQTNWSAFVRDDWKMLPNLTVLAGLRYDYYSPYVERHNRLSSLDYNADFSEIAPVQPGDVGPISGTRYPRSLINPDRNNLAPHLGFAWQANRKMAVRSGYGIYYTVAQYGTFIQNLAYQPPFAHVEINGNIPHVFTAFTLQSPFGNSADFGNYAVSHHYKLPYVQVWYLDVQQALPLDLVLDYGYAGAKGTKLDIISTPGAINATPFASAFFDYEDSSAFSNFNAFVARVRREMIHGLALSATYAYSHSIDNASSTNAGLPVVAQNPNNLLEEESNSSFDIRQQMTGSFLYQLPFAAHRALLHHPWGVSRLLAGISVDGFFSMATGVPLTPYVSATVAEAERGTHGSIRPNLIPGASVRAGGRHLDHWFNTGAFSTVFAPGQLYGTASRFSIPGPGIENVNLSASKNIPLGDSRNLLLRASANNALNTVQYSDVDTQIGSSTFGYVSGTQAMRQLTFLAKFSF